MRIEELSDRSFAQFLEEVALPKFEQGTLEHGVETWRTVNLFSYMAEEQMDLGFYHLLQAIKFRELAEVYDVRWEDKEEQRALPAVQRGVGE